MVYPGTFESLESEVMAIFKRLSLNCHYDLGQVAYTHMKVVNIWSIQTFPQLRFQFLDSTIVLREM